MPLSKQHIDRAINAFITALCLSIAVLAERLHLIQRQRQHLFQQQLGVSPPRLSSTSNKASNYHPANLYQASG